MCVVKLSQVTAQQNVSLPHVLMRQLSGMVLFCVLWRCWSKQISRRLCNREWPLLSVIVRQMPIQASADIVIIVLKFSFVCISPKTGRIWTKLGRGMGVWRKDPTTFFDEIDPGPQSQRKGPKTKCLLLRFIFQQKYYAQIPRSLSRIRESLTAWIIS